MKNKYNILLVVLLLVNFPSFSQSNAIEEGEVIVLTNVVPVNGTPISLIGSNDALVNSATYLNVNVKFRVIEIAIDTVQLIAIKFKKDDSQKGKLYNNIIYKISRDHFNQFAVLSPPVERFSIGLLTLPFKARPQNDFSFDTEFNLSSTLNIRLSEVGGATFNYQIGAGIGSVGLNTSNAAGLENDEAQDVATLTFSNGFMLQYRRVQVGLYAGVDQINNQKNYKWESNGNIWFGFGIGYNLFDISLSNQQKQNR